MGTIVGTDRIRFTTTSTGTGSITAGAAAIRKRGLSVLADGVVVPYVIEGRGDSTEWEEGYGTVGSSGTVLARTTVLFSSNADALVEFSAGTKDVFISIPAEMIHDGTAIKDKALSISQLADGVDGNLITWSADGVAALVDTGTQDHVLTSNGAGAAPTFQAVPSSSPELGFLNKSSWVNSEMARIALDTPMAAIGKCHVSVFEEVPQDGLTSSEWDVSTNDTGFTLADSAYAVTVTPAATSGLHVNFTLGSGNWSVNDIGKRIVNTSTGEAGEARIISVSSGVAECNITTTFTDTNAIASGDWKLYSGEFVLGNFVLSSSLGGGVWGTAFTFRETTASNTVVIALTDTKAICCFVDGSTNYNTYAVVLTIDNTTITAGTPVVVKYAPVSSLTIAALSATKAILCFNAGNGDGTAVILNVSGATITVGTSVTYETAYDCNTQSVTALSETQAVIGYLAIVDGNFEFYGVVLGISGSTITAGSRVQIDPSFSDDPSLIALSSTQIVACNSFYGGGLYQGRARILNVSGTSFTTGTALAYSPSSLALFNAAARLSDTKALICFNHLDDSQKGKCCVLSVSGSTITAGSIATYETTAINRQKVAALSATQAMVHYIDDGDSSHSKSALLNISGTTVTPEAVQVVFDTGTTSFPGITALSATKVIVVAEDLGESGYGKARVAKTVSDVYVSGQHVPTISGTDSVDTVYYSDINSIAVTEVLYGQTANYAFSFNPTFTGSLVTGGTFVIIGAGETTVRNIASSLASVHGGTDGAWYVNTNATYGSSTWEASTVNTAHGALTQAMATTKNYMTGAAVAAVSDANWPAFQDMFATAIILYSGSDAVTPTVDKVTFNYNANIKYVESTAAYAIDIKDVDTIQVTAPDTGSTRNARVYISK